MSSLKGKIAVMAVNLPDKKLFVKDRVEILRSWKEALFLGEALLGKRRRLRIKSLERPGIEEEVDFADVLIRDNHLIGIEAIKNSKK